MSASEANTPIRSRGAEKTSTIAIDKVIPSVKKREIDFCRICVIPTQTSGYTGYIWKSLQETLLSIDLWLINKSYSS